MGERAGVAPDGKESITLTVVRRPFARAEVITRRVEPGKAVGFILDDIGFTVPEGCGAMVSIFGRRTGWRALSAADWDVTIPCPGDAITVNVLPRLGGGKKGKSPFQTILLIAAVAISFAAPEGSFLLAPLFTGTSLTVGQAIGFGLTLLGGLFAPTPSAPALAAPQRQDAPSAPVFSVSGGGNRAVPFGPIWRLFGRRRMSPPLAANWFTEIRGNDQYFHQILDCGYGPIQISDIRIGETPIAQFSDVEIEIRQGWGKTHPSWEGPRTLFTNDVSEDSIGTILSQAAPAIERDTLVATDEISLDIMFVKGLVAVTTLDGQGNPGPARKVDTSVDFTVDFAPFGTSNWAPVPWANASDPGFGTPGQISITAHSSNLVRRSGRWAVAAGQYRVRIARTTADSTSTTVVDEATWTVLRSIRHTDPVPQDGIATLAVVIRASEQFSGPVKNINLIGESILPVWDGVAWTDQVSRDPAWATVEILRGAASPVPQPDASFDLPAYIAWAVDNAANGRNFDRIFNATTTVFQALRDAFEAGRAEFGTLDGKFSVVRDLAQTVPVQIFTPHNMRDFIVERDYPDRPDGWRVFFDNEDKGWARDERIVPRDGFTEQTVVRLEDARVAGITNAAQVHREFKHRELVSVLRPDRVNFVVHQEHLVARPGDLIGVTSPVTSWGLGSGRIVSADVTGAILDEAVPMAVLAAYSLRVRDDDTGAMSVHPLKAVNQSGDYATVVFEPALVPGTEPLAGQLFQFGETSFLAQDMKIKRIQFRDAETATVHCVRDAPQILARDSDIIPPFVSRISPTIDTTRRPATPVVLSVRSGEDVLIEKSDGSFTPRILIALSPGSGGALPTESVEVKIKEVGSADAGFRLILPMAPELSVVPVTEGVHYRIELVAIARDFSASDAAIIADHKVIGQSTPPPDLPFLTVEGKRLVWTYPSPPRDLAGFLARSQAGNNKDFDTAVPAHDGVWPASPFDISGLGGGLRTIMVKAVDRAGNVSVNARAVVRDLGQPLVANVFDIVDQRALVWPGTITNGEVFAGDLRAVTPAGANLWPPDPMAALWPADPAANLWDITFGALAYTVSYVTPADGNLTLDVAASGAGWSLAYRTDPEGDIWPTIPGVPFWPAIGPLWPGLNPFSPWPGSLALIKGRNIEVKLAVAGGLTRGVVTKFTIKLDVPDVAEQLAGVAIAAAGTRLPIVKSYRAIASVNLTLNDDGGAAVSAMVVDSDPTLGPLIKTIDSARAGVAGNVSATVQGY